MRKTVNVADLLEYANYNLEHGKCDVQKAGLRSMIESVLHASGNYKGFSHNYSPLREKEMFETNRNSVSYIPSSKLMKEYMALAQLRYDNDGFRSIGQTK